MGDPDEFESRIFSDELGMCSWFNRGGRRFDSGRIRRLSEAMLVFTFSILVGSSLSDKSTRTFHLRLF